MADHPRQSGYLQLDSENEADSGEIMPACWCCVCLSGGLRGG